MNDSYNNRWYKKNYSIKLLLLKLQLAVENDNSLFLGAYFMFECTREESEKNFPSDKEGKTTNLSMRNELFIEQPLTQQS